MSTGIPEPVILCPVPSSKCKSSLVLFPPVSSNVLVPPAGVDADPLTAYVNCVVDVTVISFAPLYAVGVAPAIVTVSSEVRPCADEVVTVAVVLDLVIEEIEPVIPPCVIAFETVIIPFSATPAVSIETIVVFVGIPVPSIVEPITSLSVEIFVIVVEPTDKFANNSNCLAA